MQKEGWQRVRAGGIGCEKTQRQSTTQQRQGIPCLVSGKESSKDEAGGPGRGMTELG